MSRKLQPPSLLSLAIESGIRNISRIPDLSSLPDHVVFDLFQVLSPSQCFDFNLRLVEFTFLTVNLNIS